MAVARSSAPRRNTTGFTSRLMLATALLAGCTGEPSPSAGPSPQTLPAAAPARLPAGAPAAAPVATPQRFVVVAPKAPDSGTAIAVDQFADWIDKATTLPVTVVADGAPLTLDPATVVFALGPGALSEGLIPASQRDALPDESYVVRRGTKDGATVYAAAGPDPLGHQYAAYALLEALGFGFFHPLETYVPDSLTLPDTLDRTLSPGYPWRGMHLHTMHPIELMDSLLVPSQEHLEEVFRYIDWLVANRQDYFQWVLQDTIDIDAWIPHAQAIVDYAHKRGIRVGIDTPFQFIQQNGWVLVPYPGPWERQLVSRLGIVLEVPFDVINVELGASEFIPADDVQTMDMLNFTSDYLMSKYGVELISKVHVSSGQTAPNYGDINFNFLPGLANPLVGVLPHSVQFYDFYRPAPTYDNEDFSEIREFLLEEIPERVVLTYPETAYWCSFDIDVPLFLPQYVYSRWNDLHQLRDSGMDGQVNFSSGFEWGYWLNDFATAAFAYEPGGSWQDPVKRFTRIFGPAAGDMQTLLEELITQQGTDLLEGNLIAWLVGWDAADDLGHLVDTHAQPVRTLFWEVRQMNERELIEFESTMMPRLAALEARYDGFVQRIRGMEARIPASSVKWYREVRRALEVLDYRVKHIYRLYAGTIARTKEKLGIDANGEAQAQLLFADAQSWRRQAEGLVQAQEQEYRLPAERLARLRENPTSYEYGYLYTASDLYFWRREELQAIDNNICPCMGNLNDMISNLVGEGHPLQRVLEAVPTLRSDCLDQCFNPIDRISDLGGSQ